MLKRISLGLSLLLLLLLIGCSAGKKLVYSPIYTSGRNYVKLMKVVHEKTGEPLETAYDHPKQLTPDKLQYWLESLYYEHYQWSTFGFDNEWVKGRVFEPQAIAELVPQLASAFSQATASDIIMFSIGDRDGDTSGKMWLKDNYWVCELHQIDGYDYKGEDSSRLDNHDWRLVEAEGQEVSRDQAKRCFVVAINLQTELGEIQPPLASEGKTTPLVTHKPHPASAPRPQLQTTDQKLRLLKQWLDDGLITQKQYQEKVDSLLEKF